MDGTSGINSARSSVAISPTRATPQLSARQSAFVYDDDDGDGDRDGDGDGDGN